ncbi:MAG: zinc metallopeptidase, partial [Bacteroidota bacterium]
MNGDYMIYYALAGVLTMIGMFVSNRLKSTFEKYSRVGLRSGMSGQEAAAEMLRHYNIGDVRIVRGQGYLTDHYNPLTKTVSLSPPVYDGRSISAAAVAA